MLKDRSCCVWQAVTQPQVEEGDKEGTKLVLQLKGQESQLGRGTNHLLVSAPRVIQLPGLAQGIDSENRNQTLLSQQNGSSTRFLPLPP